MIDGILTEETTDNRLNKLLKDERGLSLVELLAVVVILAIIAGIGVIAIGNVIQNSREDAVVSEIQQAFSAAVLYQSTNHELNNGEADSEIFTLQDVMSDRLLNSTSWSAPDTVRFFIVSDGGLRMYVPGGVLTAGQESNTPLGENTPDGALSQNQINSLNRNRVFGTEEIDDDENDD